MKIFFGPLIGVLDGVKVEKVCSNDYEIFKELWNMKSFQKNIKTKFFLSTQPGLLIGVQ
jgi:hypothetical protein